MDEPYVKFWLQGLNFVKSMLADNLWAINMVDFNLLSCSELPFTYSVQTVVRYMRNNPDTVVPRPTLSLCSQKT